MAKSLLEDAFSHHIWATRRLIDTCRSLDDDQLEATFTGTFGSIIDTLRHLVAADAAYLYALTGGRHEMIDERGMDLDDLRSVIDDNENVWSRLLGQDLDPEAIVIRHRDDGSTSHAPLGIRLAQAVHHGTDHRSQVCTILTELGIQPPAIDVWDYADSRGWLHENPPT